MARWKLALLATIVLVPLWLLGPMNVGLVISSAFIVLMLVVPRAMGQRKWFALGTGAVVLVLPIVTALASRRLDLLPLALATTAVMGLAIAVPWWRQRHR